MAQSPQKYDLIIVGGGIYGIFLALEAGRRGLRSVLLEKDTWGAGTTGGWLRILHGGLRYLQTMDLPRFYESVRERRWYMQLFPELVRPLPCVMPLYRDHSHSPLIMRAALAANDVLSAHRNRGVPSGNHLPRGRVLSAEDVRSMLPFAETAGLRAGALWYDAMAIEPELGTRGGGTRAHGSRGRDRVGRPCGRDAPPQGVTRPRDCALRAA